MNYLIMEAVAIKVKSEDYEAQKKAEKEADRKRFKQEATTDLSQFRSGLPAQ